MISKKQARNNFSGIIVCDKPKNWTSHDVVAKLRGLFKLKKIGHAGTLDPIATGVLVLLVGKATKLSNELIADEKEYRFDLLFGITTDTQDITGKVIQRDDEPLMRSAAEIEKVLEKFRGEITQTPPMFSAVKIKGKKLYELGRKGITVERPARKIFINELKLEKLNWPRATLLATCSKGTYIRTLCNDIAENLCDAGGCMESLIRLRSGQFTIQQAYKIDEIISWQPDEFEKNLIPV